MLIEHTFVTTMPAPEAMAAASKMLGDRGFVSELNSAFRLDEGQWNRLQMKRGSSKASAAKDPTRSPQRVHLEWDRGRVTVAASVEPKVRRRSFSLSASSTVLSGPGKKVLRNYEDLMLAIVESIELLLVNRASEAEATRNWLAVEAVLIEKARKARRRAISFLIIFFLVIFGAIGLIIFFAASH